MESTRHEPDQFFRMPKDIVKQAVRDSRDGIRIAVKPSEFIKVMMQMDELMDQDSGDGDHDAMRVAREFLSEIFEDPSRRVSKP